MNDWAPLFVGNWLFALDNFRCVPRQWDFPSGSSFLFSPNQVLGEVLSSQIEEPQKNPAHLYRSTRRITKRSLGSDRLLECLRVGPFKARTSAGLYPYFDCHTTCHLATRVACTICTCKDGCPCVYGKGGGSVANEGSKSDEAGGGMLDVLDDGLARLERTTST